MGKTNLCFQRKSNFKVNCKKFDYKKIIQIVLYFRLDSPDQTYPFKSNETLTPVPYNLTLYRGYKNVILSRNYSHFILTHTVPKMFRNWIANTLISDESYFTTLSRITGIKQNGTSYQVTQDLRYFSCLCTY